MSRSTRTTFFFASLSTSTSTYAEEYLGGSSTDSGAQTVSYRIEAENTNSDTDTIYHNVTIVQPNTAPTITWINYPASAYVNQWFNVQARGDDAEGNLTWVRVWKNDVAFAFNGGGTGYQGYSDNNGAVGTSVGTITFKAKSGDSASAESAYIYHNVSIVKQNQSISFTQPAAQTYGAAPISLGASATSGLGVSFARLSGPGSVSGNTLTLTGAGNIVVRASQGGNGAYNAAGNVDRTVTVYKASQTITFNQPSAQTYQGQLVLSGSSSSGLGVSYAVISGPATESFGTLTFNGVGSVVVRASQAGNANYNAAANVDRTIVVNQASQTITFAQPSAQTYGTPLSLSGTSSSVLTVTYAVQSGPATVSGTTLTFTGAASVVVRASQSGNANYNAAANVDRTITVNKASQTITFAQPIAQTYGTPLTLAVNTDTPANLAITYSVTSGSATASGNVITFTDAGSVTVQASQAGNANYNAASSVSRTFTVDKADPTGTFANRSLGTQTPTTYTVVAGDLNATFSGPGGADAPTGTVTYAIVGGVAVAVDTVLTVATYTVRASYPGDAKYNAATKDASWIVTTDVDADGIPGYIEAQLGTDPNANDHESDSANQTELKIDRPIK